MQTEFAAMVEREAGVTNMNISLQRDLDITRSQFAHAEEELAVVRREVRACPQS